MADSDQKTLLNLDAKEINPTWVDPKQPLKIPDKPLHAKAHKLQLLLEVLLKQADKNPAQFNSRNFIDALNEWEKAIDKIKGVVLDDNNVDSRDVAAVGPRGKETPLGRGTSAGLGVGVSPDNPFAG